MTHKQKATLARKLSGRMTGHFESSEWQTRKERIAKRVAIRNMPKNIENYE